MRETFMFGGKEGNASCTIAPPGAVCRTPGRLAGGSIRPLDNLPPDLPTKPPPLRETFIYHVFRDSSPPVRHTPMANLSE